MPHVGFAVRVGISEIGFCVRVLGQDPNLGVWGVGIFGRVWVRGIAQRFRLRSGMWDPMAGVWILYGTLPLGFTKVNRYCAERFLHKNFGKF